MATPVPHILGWPNKAKQTHFTEKSNLVVSGCSFTSAGRHPDLACATSWPGILMDRCGIPQGIDYSFPGVGNDYIADSILQHADNMSDEDIKNTLLVVMWSGLNRINKTTTDISTTNLDGPVLNGTLYYRDAIDQPIHTNKELKEIQACHSADRIFQVYNFLTSKNISFAFSFYSNVLYPPYLPKRDLTHEFEKYVDRETLNKLRQLPWIPTNPLDFLFEYGFCKSLLADDDFHPNYQCLLDWTDQILMPGLVDSNLIYEV